jgi:ABC-type multidrug transport system fused ATPase/permease subunit
MMHLPAVISGRARRRLYALLLAIGLGQAAVATATVLLVKYGFNHFVHRAHSGRALSVLRLAGALALVAGCGAWLRMRERVEAERLGQSYTHSLRMTLYTRLATLAPRSLQRRSRGVVVLRFVGDLNAIRQWVSLGLARLTVAAIYALGAMVALTVISPTLALAVGATLSIGGVATYRLGGDLRDSARTVRRRRGQLATNVNEKVFSIAVVQAFGQLDNEQSRLRKQSNRLRNAMIDNARAAGRIAAVSEATGALAFAAALAVGSLEIAGGRTSAGTVVAAMSVVGLLVPSLRDLGQVQQYWHNSRVGIAAIQRFLDTPSLVNERPDAPDLLPAGEGRLELCDLTFGDAVKGVNAIAEPGSVVAIVGPNGAGKSTLLALAARLIDPEHGSVRLDGQDLAEHSLSSARRVIGIAGPDLPLLRGTVEMNLRYRWPDAPDAEIRRVHELCELDDVLAKLPEGESTRLAEGGQGLSAGQRQRIALARALVGYPHLLLLDEIDTNLDPDATATVDRVIDAQRGRTTVLMATHRPERIAAADAVWRLDSGRLVATETPCDDVRASPQLAGAGPADAGKR